VVTYSLPREDIYRALSRDQVRRVYQKNVLQGGAGGSFRHRSAQGQRLRNFFRGGCVFRVSCGEVNGHPGPGFWICSANRWASSKTTLGGPYMGFNFSNKRSVRRILGRESPVQDGHGPKIQRMESHHPTSSLCFPSWPNPFVKIQMLFCRWRARSPVRPLSPVVEQARIVQILEKARVLCRRNSWPVSDTARNEYLFITNRHGQRRPEP